MKMMKPRVKPAQQPGPKALTTKTRRMAGSRLQARRKALWIQDPHCEICGRVVAYPHGFELDHRTPLWQGGRDTEENCQVLCVWFDIDGEKRGCHAEKTDAEGGERPW